MSYHRPRGFTFVELLAAMIMLGVLSAIAVPHYRMFKERAYVASMRSDLGNVRIAEEEYFAEHQQYATDTAALDMRITSTVRLALSSTDVIGGYTGIATHVLMPGQQCATYSGADAVNVPSGAIICGPPATGAGTLGGGVVP
jgi:prepilin-type N-terminal cleavage/methylation domain-containing protein